MVRLHLLIRGRVQGVWFRGSAAKKAERLALRGWVRNLDDGRVEAVAEGDRARLEEFLRWCRDGPPLARVEAVDATWADREEGFDAFDVRR